MIRIEGVMENGKKVWVETNDTLVARDFIGRLESFEYKQATKNVMGVEMPKEVGGVNYIHVKVPRVFENSGR